MKILIVDDEPINRTMLVSMLSEAGFTDCVEAACGEDALAIVEQAIPDLVLLDVIMPGMSGFEVAPQIRTLAGGRYLPILFISALDDKESLVKCLEVGGNDFATKPFDKHILTAKIRAHEKIRNLSAHIEQQNEELRFYQQRVAREHAIVEHIFSHAIVNKSHILKYFDHALTPAETFNGDVFVCEASPSGGLYFLVGDFTGHGLASAIGALPVTRAFQEMSLKGLSVNEMATEFNKILLRFLPSDMFMAAVIGEVGSDGSRITLWQGGMPQMLVVSDKRKFIKTISSPHMALGILEQLEFDSECEIFEMLANDKLIIYSDGLTEAVDAQGNMLTEEGIKQWCAEVKDITAEGIFDHAKAFSATPTFDDDVSIVVFKSQALEGIKPYKATDDIPLNITITLSAKHLKQPDIQTRMLHQTSQCSGIEHVRSVLFTVVSEMFSNALEHGILNMDSRLKHSPEGFQLYYEQREKLLSALDKGTIIINIESDPAKEIVFLSIEDSGNGFEWEQKASPESNDSFGRGLGLIRALSSKVWFEKGGRKINCLLNTVVE